MIMRVTLQNLNRPEYGAVTMPFPVPRDQYDSDIEMLAALEIGDSVRQDCHIVEITGSFPVLKRLEGSQVNFDELDYLAKRLDSFDVGEAAQFQAMAHKLELFEVKDLINLTFCCQQATVITNFSDLNAVGRDHYMNLRGGHALTEELENLDGEETARLLIDSGSGTITPYGVIFDNGMKLEQVYNGTHFPCYFYEQNPLTVAMTSQREPADTKNITLHPENWQEHSYVACCGTSIQPVLKMLERLPQINTVMLCLDNDDAGHLACQRMSEQLAEHYTVKRLVPENKDWNDDLTAEKEIRNEVTQACQSFG